MVIAHDANVAGQIRTLRVARLHLFSGETQHQRDVATDIRVTHRKLTPVRQGRHVRTQTTYGAPTDSWSRVESLLGVGPFFD